MTYSGRMAIDTLEKTRNKRC